MITVTIEEVRTIHPNEATPEALDALEQRILAERRTGKVTCAVRQWQHGDTYTYVEIHDTASQHRQASEVERVRKETLVRVEKKVRAQEKAA
jgi:hypothetical protein